MEKAKYGKMRQVNAVNGSQMVVKLRGSYYRRGKEIMRVIVAVRIIISITLIYLRS